VRAQQAMPVIGTIASRLAEPYAPLLTAFRDGLAQSGFVDGRNVRIESFWANGRFDRLPALAADLVQRRPAIIFGLGIGSALAAKTAAPSTPLLFLAGDDPVKFGLVKSLNRPGGLATGLAWLTSTLLAKRLQLARELVPDASLIDILVNPKSPEVEPQISDAENTARGANQQIKLVNASSEVEIEAAFASVAEQHAGALLVSNDAFFSSQRDQITALAARHRVPTIYDRREYAAAGGLISYGTHYPLAYRELGVYAAKILRGANPADLPVEQPTKFELVINLKAAKALGLKIPPTILALSDEVIE
jgi:putative ABC transport system substrate-binding protein